MEKPEKNLEKKEFQSLVTRNRYLLIILQIRS